MCVIAVAERVRPTEEQVAQMWDANKHGGGIAWREAIEYDDNTTEMVVKWKKGLTLEEMQEANRTLPLPYILHFRIPSHNTLTGPFGCHPFPIESQVRMSLEGETPEGVLFHNGHWQTWKHKLEDTAVRGHHKIPDGGWTDSRALAWMAHHLGRGYLELIEEKVVVLTPDDIHTYGSWSFTNVDKLTFLVSNKGWEKNPPYHAGPIASLPGGTSQTTEGTGGSSRQGTFQGQGSFHAPHGAYRDSRQGNVGGAGSGYSSTVPGRGAFTQAEESGTESPRTGEEQGARQEEAEREIQHTLDTLACVVPSGRKPCYRCRSYKAGTEIEGKWYCLQCWSYTKSLKKQDNVFNIGTCGICKTASAHCRLVSDDSWVCGGCHSSNGRPEVYYGPHQLHTIIMASRDKLRARGIAPFAGHSGGGML